MQYIITRADRASVLIDASSSQEALSSYQKEPGDIILSVEPLHQKEQRDRATTYRAAEEMRIRRRKG